MAAVKGPCVFVADSHHHVLQAYAALTIESSLTLLHLDAHADLGVSALSWAQQAEAPLSELLSRLDETGEASIAEWITPLVLRSIVDSVHWILPAFMRAPTMTPAVPGRVHDWLPSQRLELLPAPLPRRSGGNTDTHSPTKAKRTSHTAPAAQHGVLPCTYLSYYVSDGPVAAPPSALGSTPPAAAASAAAAGAAGEGPACDIHVHHLPPASSDSAVLQGVQPWVLDVCLDYFHCRNEHRDILQRYLSRGEMRDATRAWAVQDAVLGMNIGDAQALVEAHSHVLGALLEAAEPGATGSDPGRGSGTSCSHEGLQEALALNAKHDSPFVSMAADLVLGILTANGWHVPDAALKAKLRGSLEHTPADGLPAALFECGPCLSLPHHAAGLGEMQQSLQALQSALRHLPSAPRVVTIACSCEDGFVPRKVALWLLPRLIQTIQQGLAHVLPGVLEVECSEHLGAELAAAAWGAGATPAAKAASTSA